MLSVIKKIYRYASLLFPFQRRRRNRVFFTVYEKGGKGGPTRFLHMLSRYMPDYGFEAAVTGGWGCGVVLFQGCAPNRWIIPVCKLLGIRTVLRVDGFYVPEAFEATGPYKEHKRELPPDADETNRKMAYSISTCDWVVYQSRFCKEMIDSYLHHREESYSLVLNGTDLEKFHAPKRKGEGRVLMLGFFRDPDLMLVSLESFFSFAKQTSTAHLTVVGKMTSQVEKVFQQFISSHEMLKDHVDYRGFLPLEELPSILAEEEVLLHLKSGDWCPNSVVESVASGLPVICVEHGGTKEIVGDFGVVISHVPYSYDEELICKAAESLDYLFENYEGLHPKNAKKVDIKSSAEQYCKALSAL